MRPHQYDFQSVSKRCIEILAMALGPGLGQELSMFFMGKPLDAECDCRRLRTNPRAIDTRRNPPLQLP
jgi:hypothetical protein